MSGAPKTASTLLPLPGERALHEKEPFGQPQEAITHSTEVPSTQCRRDRTSRHGRGGLPGPSALAEPLPAHTATQHAAVTDVASYTDVSAARLLTAQLRVTERKASSAQAVQYTVRRGDSLSAIAGRFYHKQAAWPVLYWANHSQIRWANDIGTGQVLRIPAEPAKIPGAPAQLGPDQLSQPRPRLRLRLRLRPRLRRPRPARRTHPRSPLPWWRAGIRAVRPAARSVSASWPPSPAGIRRS